MRPALRVLVGVAALAACAGQGRRGAPPADESEHTRAARRAEALCGDDLSCRDAVIRRTLHANAPPDVRPPKPPPKRTATKQGWYCFRGKNALFAYGSCEREEEACRTSAEVSEQSGVEISEPCAWQEHAVCFADQREGMVTIYCTPSEAACRDMSTAVAGQEGHELYSACERVEDGDLDPAGEG